METRLQRKQTSFRLRTDLIDNLKRAAKRENRTLNNYVESILLNIVYNEPNDITKAAILEASSGNNKNEIYSDIEDMISALNES